MNSYICNRKRKRKIQTLQFVIRANVIESSKTGEHKTNKKIKEEISSVGKLRIYLPFTINKKKRNELYTKYYVSCNVDLAEPVNPNKINIELTKICKILEMNLEKQDF